MDHGWEDGVPPEDVDWAEAVYKNPSTGWVAIFAARWAENGFPEVAIQSVKHAALMMASSVSPALAAEVRLPWPAFNIMLPSPLLEVGNEQITQALVLQGIDGRVIVVAANREGGQWTSKRRPLTEFAQDVWEHAPHAGEDSDDLGSDEKRMLSLIERVVIGVALEFDANASTAPRGRTHKRRKSDEPTIWTYKLVRDVRVDVRRWVTDYIRGGGKSPTVQSLVRGHWKFQARGPGLSERERIHIEPYWRGAEDAPIAVRTHRLPSPSK